MLQKVFVIHQQNTVKQLEHYRSEAFVFQKNDYYNLARSEANHSIKKELQFALGTLKTEGFHIRCMEKNLVENNLPKQMVIQNFFFYNEDQINRSRWFVSRFLIETDATFNTNQLNLPLYILV